MKHFNKSLLLVALVGGFCCFPEMAFAFGDAIAGKLNDGRAQVLFIIKAVAALAVFVSIGKIAFDAMFGDHINWKPLISIGIVAVVIGVLTTILEFLELI